MLPGIAGVGGFSAAAAGGGGPTASPHRYWRIWIAKNSDTDQTRLVTGISEMEMRESVGGADATGSGTASADSTFAGFSAAGAFANDGTTTEWASGNTAFPHWLAYDFGAANDKAIVEVAIDGRSNNDQWPGSFKIQSSDDGTTWADEWWVVYPGGSNGHGYVAGTLKAFTKPTVSQTTGANQHAYWRLSITGSNGGSFVGANDIAMRVVSGSVDETEDGTATSRSNFSGLPPSQAFEGTVGYLAATAVEWASNNVGFPEWIQYQFPRAVEITEVMYRARGGLGTSQSPTGIDFQYSDDGSSWTTIKSVSSLSWTANEMKTWTLP